MGKHEIELAEIDLAIAHRLFDNTIEGAGRIMRARLALQFAVADSCYDELSAVALVCSAVAEYGENLLAAGNGDGVILCAVQQSEGAAKFLASETGSEDGWTWPVQVIKAGWAAGSLQGAEGTETTPHYFPPEVVAEVAQAANGARFRRRHPATGDGHDAPELTAGWISDGRVSGSAAFATVNLLSNAEDVRSMLLSAKEAGKLNLFSVSIFGYFSFKRSQIDGKPALVASGLQKFIGLDLCAEPGAGGRFLGSAGAN